MSKIVKCKKCGGLIDTLYQDIGRIKCRWCGKSFNRKGVIVIKKIKIPENAITILQKYFRKKQLRSILRQS